MMEGKVSDTPKRIIKCGICGKEFETGNGRALFCSSECRKKNRMNIQNARRKTVRCLRCGDPFEVPYNSDRCICPECKAEDTRERKRRKRMEHEAKKKSKMLCPVRTPKLKDIPATYANPVVIRTAEEVAEPKKVLNATLKVDPLKLRKPLLAPTRSHTEVKKPEHIYEDVMGLYSGNRQKKDAM